MFIVTVIVSVILAAVLTGSAAAKLAKNPKVVEGIVGKVGFPEDKLWMLAGLELAGAAGLIIGLFWTPLGIAAAVGVILYFIGALIGHIRAHDTAPASVSAPGGILALAIVALVLRSATA